MTIYQITNGDLFYRRGSGKHWSWVEQGGSVWTSRKGASCALNQIRIRDRKKGVPEQSYEILESPMFSPRISLVKCDGWKAFYSDGKLRGQGERPDAEQILRNMGFLVRTRTLDTGYMLGKPMLPDNLEDL